MSRRLCVAELLILAAEQSYNSLVFKWAVCSEAFCTDSSPIGMPLLCLVRLVTVVSLLSYPQGFSLLRPFPSFLTDLARFGAVAVHITVFCKMRM